VSFDLIAAFPQAVLLRVWAGGGAKAIDRPVETGQIVVGQLCASTVAVENVVFRFIETRTVQRWGMQT
jgi:hypothetical protein